MPHHQKDFQSNKKRRIKAKKAKKLKQYLEAKNSAEEETQSASSKSSHTSINEYLKAGEIYLPKEYMEAYERLLGGCGNKGGDVDFKRLEGNSSEAKAEATERCSFVNTVSKFGYLGIALYYNFWCSLLWAYWRYDYQGRDTHDFDAENFGQWLASAGGAVLGGIFHFLACYANSYPFPFKKSVLATVSTLLSVPAWNKVENIAEIGFANGVSAEAAAYLAGFPAGIVGSLVQKSVTTLGKLFLKEKERELCKKDPKIYFSKKLFFAISVDAVPQAVWQWVHEICQTNNVNQFVTAVSVAATVLVIDFGTNRTKKCCLKPSASTLSNTAGKSGSPVHAGKSKEDPAPAQAQGQDDRLLGDPFLREDSGVQPSMV